MKILTTLDYELFFGQKTGSVQKCLIEPMDKLITIGDKYGVKFTLFVDATYLYRLDTYKLQYQNLAKDLDDISVHLKSLIKQGHDIQLHIHPHWAYSTYNGTEWILDNEHYKLSDLLEEEAQTIFSESKRILENIIEKKVFVFRAGGFSAQPTNRLIKLFEKHDIKIDSSVYPRNYYNSCYQQYDYRNCPAKDTYHFKEDICQENNSGRFLEVPISTFRLSPLFYWKLAATKLRKPSIHKNIGDGISVETTNDSIVARLTKYTDGFATIDGYKISYLNSAFNFHLKNNNIFCIIGHPKLTTSYSLKKFQVFCEKICYEHEFVTFIDIIR